jgi:hypothetical protein
VTWSLLGRRKNGWVERGRNALLPGAHQGRREVTRNGNGEGGTANRGFDAEGSEHAAVTCCGGRSLSTPGCQDPGGAGPRAAMMK